MTELIAAAVTALASKLAGRGFDGSARFVITGEGALLLDRDGVRALGDTEGGADSAEVTLSADAQTFQAILAGDLGAMPAYMSGRLKIDGDISAALRLGSVLA